MKLNTRSDSRVVLSWAFGAYLLYTLAVSLTEWCNFFIWYNGWPYHFGISELLSAALLCAIIHLFRKKLCFDRTGTERKVWIGAILILIYGILLSVYPDTSFDTLNYHLIAQDPQWCNYFETDFGYGNFQVWGFRLTDHMFYYFRWLLGYRFGTLLNAVAMEVSYLQLCKLLGWLKEDIYRDRKIAAQKRKRKLDGMICEPWIWSLVILLPMDSFMMFGTYYVDIIAIPIALEILRILLEERDKEQTAFRVVYFALLNGMWIACKVVNGIYVLPCVLLYLIQHWKDFNVGKLAEAFFAGAYSFADDVCYNYICTSNPIFPYYNTVFHSKYFVDFNFKDARWGGKTLLQKIVWPLHVVIAPENRTSEIYDTWPVAFALGIATLCIFTVVYFRRWIRKHDAPNREIVLLIVLALSTSALWSFSLGYTRYYIVGKIYWGLFAFMLVVILAGSERAASRFASGVCTLAVLTGVIVDGKLVLSGQNWKWTGYSGETFFKELSQTMKDRDPVKPPMHQADLYVLTTHTHMGVAELLAPETYAVNMNAFEWISPELMDPGAFLREKITQAEWTCDLHERSFYNVAEYVEEMNVQGLYILDMEPVSVSLGEYEQIHLKLSEGYENTVFIGNQGYTRMNVSDRSGPCELSFIAGRMYDWEGSPSVSVQIYIINGGNESIVACEKIDNMEINSFHIPLHLEKSDTEVAIRFVYDNGEPIAEDEVNLPFMLNATIGG